MNRALLPALIASVLASNFAIASDRELLFGPTDKVERTLNIKAPTPEDQSAYLVSKSSRSAPDVRVSTPVKTVKKIKTSPVEKSGVKNAAVQTAAQTAVGIVIEEKKAIAPSNRGEPASRLIKAEKTDVVEKVRISTGARSIPDGTTSGMKELIPVTVINGADALAIREELVKKSTTEMTIGFYPSSYNAPSAFHFMEDFLPLSNHLSQYGGVLKSLVPERDPEVYSRRILEQKYPAIFINSTLTDSAITAEYQPIVVLEEKTTPYYLVKSKSKFTKVSDFNSVSIAYDKKDEVSFLAFADLANHNISGPKNTFISVNKFDRDGALALLNSGQADVAIFQSEVARKLVEESKGNLRFLVSDFSAHSGGMWIRKDLVGSDIEHSIREAILLMGPGQVGSAKLAAQGFARGYGVPGKFISADTEISKEFVKQFAAAKRIYPELFPKSQPVQSVVLANLARPVTSPLSLLKTDDPLKTRKQLAEKYTESFDFGIYPLGDNDEGVYGFIKKSVPFANHLSMVTGNLANLIPERSIKYFSERILQKKYPVVFVDPILAHSAANAGYIPIALAEREISPGYLVPAKSPIVNVKDIRGVRVLKSQDDQLSYLVLADLAKNKIFKGVNTFKDADRAGSKSVSDVINSGDADVAIMEAEEAKSLAAASKGKFRFIPSSTTFPSRSVWVRKDIEGSKVAIGIESALLATNSEAKVSAKDTHESSKSLLGDQGRFKPATPHFAEYISEMSDLIKVYYPDSFAKIVFDKSNKVEVDSNTLLLKTVQKTKIFQ